MNPKKRAVAKQLWQAIGPAQWRGAHGSWLLLLAGVALWSYIGSRDLCHGKAPAGIVPGGSPNRAVTFSKDIAPLTLQHCAGCHRPGQSAPFSLITYQDVRKHAQAIVEVTARRYMPPWLPEPGELELVGTRRLKDTEISLLARWHAEGDPEGNPVDLPPIPTWPDGWQLGQPDLVVTPDRAYTLPAEGKDVYRNFVLPLPIHTTRYVSGVEFRAGNRSVHHAFMRFDRTRESRRADGQDGAPGFDGMDTPSSAEGPEGYFLSWQPGKVAMRSPEGLAWALKAGSDLVLQLHLQVTGKPEMIQPTVAFYFTDKPPTQIPFKIALRSYDIDIPAGATEYWVRDAYTVPVDVEVLGLLPHAHYLGKELRAEALLPDGSRKSLLLIKHWDFNWQGDYRYAQPVFLPSGSTLLMEYSYDNSTNNTRNPHFPPQPVQYGLQTSDEMAGLMVQVRLHSPSDLERLARHYQSKVVESVIAYNSYALRTDPGNARAHLELGKALWALGKKREAWEHFQRAVALKPTLADAHYHLGMMLEEFDRAGLAEQEYREALRLNPDLFEAHNNLGLLLMQKGQLPQAEQHFRTAVRLSPDDSIARSNLDLLQRSPGGP
jgi:tetratricopeptide (TPR) repeat protein